MKMNRIESVVTGNVFVFTEGNSSGDLIHVKRSEHQKAEKSVWSFDIENTTNPLIFYSPDIVPTDTLPPNHIAWHKIEALFEQVDAIDIEVEEDAHEWLQNLRAEADERITKYYGPEGWN